MANSVPARWLPYEALGESIPGTRFISFKVPLKEEICNKLPPNERFTPCMLVEKVTSLGLIIDLTNTTRYYNPEMFKRMGVQHAKILCEGHKVPNTTVVAQFYAVVDDYLKKNPENETLIGVHCTHGVNRTGYLVCRYMIDKLGFQPDAAIDAFNKARHHNIERPLYLESLRLAAGDDSTSIAMGLSSNLPTESDDFPSYSQGVRTRPTRFGPEDCHPYISPSQRSAIPNYRQQRTHRERGDYWRSGDRPPPRPPARAGWRTPYPQQPFADFRSYPTPDCNFNYYRRPDAGFSNYRMHYSSSSDAYRNEELVNHSFPSHTYQSVPRTSFQQNTRHNDGAWKWEKNGNNRLNWS